MFVQTVAQIQKVYKAKAYFIPIRTNMTKRFGFNINAKEMKRLKEIETIRPDLRGHTLAERMHIALQEWFKVNFEEALKKGVKLPKAKTS